MVARDPGPLRHAVRVHRRHPARVRAAAVRVAAGAGAARGRGGARRSRGSLDVLARARCGRATLLRIPANAWFAIGPALVFAIAGVPPGDAGPLLLVAALAAQFAGDFARLGRSTSRVASGAEPALPAGRELGVPDRRRAVGGRRSSSPRRCTRAAYAVLARRAAARAAGDVRQRAPGTAGQPAGAQRHLPRHRAAARRRHLRRRRLHRRALQGVVGLALAVGDAARPGRRAPAQPRVRRAAARCRQDRDPQGDHQQARQARPRTSGRSSRPTPSRASGCSTGSAGFMRDVGRIVRAHHERWDGGGYPDGWPGRRSRSRRGSSPAVTPGAPCAPTAPTGRRCPFDGRLEELRVNVGTQFDPRGRRRRSSGSSPRRPARAGRPELVAPAAAVVAAAEQLATAATVR